MPDQTMQNYIEKVCRGQKSYLNELFVYQSDFSNKPALIEVIKPHTLFLEKVKGIPYLDFECLSDTMLIKLAQTISRFHNIIHLGDRVLCHWDNQPRNILWNEQKQKFYIVDFEDIRLARPEADLAHLFLFWAEVMSYKDFSRSVTILIKDYQKTRRLSAELWKTESRKARHRFDARRRRHNKLEKTNNPDRRKNRKLLINLQML
ncbi:MAG: phosphotransferase [Candidatus Cloacimonadaceae bacterium]